MNDFTDATRKQKATILIVEDHNELRSSLTEWLQSIFRDCNFMAARTGEEAIDLGSTYRPGIVLMDIQLPQMNGIETIRHIKKNSPQTQAVILSVHNLAVYREEAMAAGACAYINKHNMHVELIPILVKLLPSSASPRAAASRRPLPAPAPAAGEQVTYVVRGGDTLFQIAQSYKTTVEKIKAETGLASDILFVGQKLVITAGKTG